VKIFVDVEYILLLLQFPENGVAFYIFAGPTAFFYAHLCVEIHKEVLADKILRHIKLYRASKSAYASTPCMKS
jgi:hypothetical protein